MESVALLEIGLDAEGRLYVVPETQDLDFIYRAARGVRWDSAKRALYTPSPGQLSCAQWFKIFRLAAQEEYGVALDITSSTAWTAIDAETRREIKAVTY